MQDNKYLEKIAKSSTLSLAEVRIKKALSSRTPIKKHSIGYSPVSRKSLPMQKTSILEKRAFASKAMGFKTPPATSGVRRMKLKPMNTDIKQSIPKTFNQSVSNPNKSLVKSSAVVDRMAYILRGAGSSIGSGAKSVAQRAGGKNVLDHVRASNVKVHKTFRKLPYAEKIKLLEATTPGSSAKFKQLIGERDATRLMLLATTPVVAQQGKKGYDYTKKELERKRRERLIRQYYGR